MCLYHVKKIPYWPWQDREVLYKYKTSIPTIHSDVEAQQGIELYQSAHKEMLASLNNWTLPKPYYLNWVPIPLWQVTGMPVSKV